VDPDEEIALFAVIMISLELLLGANGCTFATF